MKIASLAKTCERNPSQWEGELGDGVPVLVRYRYGYLTVYRGTEYDEELFSQRVTEDRHSGEMSTEDMLRITGYEIEPLPPWHFEPPHLPDEKSLGMYSDGWTSL